MKKIFLLDDNIMSCEKALEKLEEEFEVYRCKEVLSAARRIHLIEYDMFIIDLMMPTKGLDNLDEFSAGFSFYDKYVKQGWPDVPVLFWTNLTDGSFKSFQANHGKPNLFYLQKSDNDLELLEKVKEILNQ